ncbi:MAG: Smr/MutS family protein [Myxococcota bacterium]
MGELTRTPRGRQWLLEPGPEAGPELFASSDAEAQARQELTAEARAILESGVAPPLGGTQPLEEPLGRAARGGALTGDELRDVAHTVDTLHRARRFLAARADEAPELADLASLLPELTALASQIHDCIDEGGAVRDDASAALANGRREAHELASRIQDRLARILRDETVRGALSDAYFTVRNDRYVLPVRADARGTVRGIVHDASGSGTTLYIEPEGLVELNNQHKRAELEVEREIARILRELSAAAARSSPEVLGGLDTLALLDLAFARAALAIELNAVRPELQDGGVLSLPQLRHPCLDPDSAVPNDVRLGDGLQVLVVSGPNAGGKTVAMKAAALAVLFTRAGLQVPAETPARFDLFDAVLADIGDEQSIGQNLSTFSAHMANLARIVDEATDRSLVVLDEIGVGTDPGEGAAIAQAILETLADTGATVITTTHYGLLKEMADVDPRFTNASVEFDPETLAPTYRLRVGVPGTSSATAVAARMGLRSDVLDRAHTFLEREDRKLDRMLHELATSRAALDSEQREASRLREETEAARTEYREKLERLQERRDQLYRSMRDDLDAAFRDAHGQIAAVIRDLQRGGANRGQQATRARERLVALAERQDVKEREAGVQPTPDERPTPIDWSQVRPGDRVRVLGGGEGTVHALPDRRGRARIEVGAARLTVPADRVVAVADSTQPRKPRTAPKPRPTPVPAPAEGGTERCDLRGQRVAEAIDALTEALDRATSSGRDRLLVVHGLGTGALRRAVREHLVQSPYVSGVAAAGADEGGDGASVALLR